LKGGIESEGQPARRGVIERTFFVACLSDAVNVSAAADHIPIHIAHE
jgi:hypothetical protein